MMEFVRSHASSTKHSQTVELIQPSRYGFFGGGKLHPFIRRLRTCIFRLPVVVQTKQICILLPSGGPPGSIRDITPRYDVQPVRPESEYHPGAQAGR